MINMYVVLFSIVCDFIWCFILLAAILLYLFFIIIIYYYLKKY